MSEESGGPLQQQRPPAWLLDSLASPDPGVCERALIALKQFQHPDVNAAVAKLLAHDDAGLRQRASQFLVDQGEFALDALMKSLAFPHEQARRLAARSLGRMADVRAVFALMRALSDTAAPVRCEAAKALRRLRAPQAALALRRALSDEDPDVREAVERALAALDNKKPQE